MKREASSGFISILGCRTRPSIHARFYSYMAYGIM
jgi:hypothetical protein